MASALAALYPGLGEHLDLMIRYLSAPAEHQDRLLDVGCGDGEALDILRLLRWQVVGVELDGNAVESARSRGLDVRHGDLAAAGFAKDSFDAVTSSHVIEHVHDPFAFLIEQKRVLKSGGRLVAVTPNVRGPIHGKHAQHWLNLDPPRHLVVFTPASLKRLAIAAGFSDIQVTTTSRAVALAEIASSKMRADGSYRWGSWPGLWTWLKAQAIQWIATLGVKTGRLEGEELVLLATK